MKFVIDLTSLDLQSVDSVHIENDIMTVTGYKEIPIRAEFKIPIKEDNRYFKLG